MNASSRQEAASGVRASFGYTHSIPSFADLGGESAAFTGDADALTAAMALCDAWPAIGDQAGARAWLLSSVPMFDVAELIDFNDVALTSYGALNGLAPTFRSVWEQIGGTDTGLRGSVALEGWTRMAIAGWTSTLPIRGALADRATMARDGEASADVFLVRSLGAALDQWPDEELVAGLVALLGDDVAECNAAFELGMAEIRSAVEAVDEMDAIDHLDAARRWYDRSQIEGRRPDAEAFGGACEAIASFLAKRPVSDELVERVHAAVRDWLLGYLGETPHWRQPRVDTGAAWAVLLRDIQRLRELDHHAWFDPLNLLADVGHVYVAHNAAALLASPSILGNDEGPGSATAAPVADPESTVLPLALGARLDSALAATAERVAYVDRWLAVLESGAAADSHREVPLAEIQAIRRGRERIRNREELPGKAGASRDVPQVAREATPSLRTIVQFALPNGVGLTGLVPIDGVALLKTVPRELSLMHSAVLRRLTGELQAIDPVRFEAWSVHLVLLLDALITCVSETLDREQGGIRSHAWTRGSDSETTTPESVLADFLAQMIRGITKLPTKTEVPNVGGGRVDILVQHGLETFVIEVKRATTLQSNAKLVEKYGNQAGQYTLTGPPFAFLAVLDLSQWESRLDLDHSFWTSEWSVPVSGDIRALTALRVLAAVEAPSTLSRRRRGDPPGVTGG